VNCKPLEGIRVVDASHVIAGPLTSFYLAQLGAEVIKVEKPGEGDVMRGGGAPTHGDTPDGFVALNAGKRSVCCDIRTAEGSAQVKQLARKADVFLENLRPGVMARHGLGYEALREINPGIVYCSISGYGQKGNWAHRGGYDHVIQALTGMMMMSGDPQDDGPVKVGFPVIDVAVGMHSALAIVSALHARRSTDAGIYIDSSMVQSSLMLMYPQATTFLSSGKLPARLGNRGYSGSPGADTYRCLDGWIAVGANTPSQFRKLTEVLNLPDICSDPQLVDVASFEPGEGFVRAKDAAAIRRSFEEAFLVVHAAEMEQRLNDLGVPAARVRRLGEFLSEAKDNTDLHLPWRTFMQDGRTVETTGLGFSLEGEERTSLAGAEHLGASDHLLSVY
jgi:crotonobetainyl-CoA:carnitine CoA-transferase CaiB-like acyl-CoA transferase